MEMDGWMDGWNDQNETIDMSIQGDSGSYPAFLCAYHPSNGVSHNLRHSTLSPMIFLVHH
jgi:hypothetical protein